MLGSTSVTVLPKIPKVQRLGMAPGGSSRGRGDRIGGGGPGGGGGGDFRRPGSQGTFGGRGEQHAHLLGMEMRK